MVAAVNRAAAPSVAGPRGTRRITPSIVVRQDEAPVRILGIGEHHRGSCLSTRPLQTSAGQTWALSQRILTDVAWYSEGLTGQVAVSIGMSELSAATDVESDGMLAAADAALYGAKDAAGGHHVIAHEEAGACRGRRLTLTEATLLVENRKHMP